MAALLVLAHHIQGQMPGPEIFSRGFLAVDFFFVLSGFVVAAAYEHRLRGGMNLLNFAQIRLLRLYPLMFVGALTAAVVVAIKDGGLSYSALTLVGQLLLIPGLSGGTTLFLLNSAYWSLFFELAANFGHAASLRWATTRRLAFVVAMAAFAVIFTAHRMHHLGGGWSTDNWWAGFVRVGFSYPLGVLLYRLHAAERLPALNLPFTGTALLLVFAVVGASRLGAWWSDAFTVLLVFPLIVGLGIRSDPGRLRGASEWLGGISFPLYVIHSPLVELWGKFVPPTLPSAITGFAACVVLASLVQLYVEPPTRRGFTALVARAGRLTAPAKA